MELNSAEVTNLRKRIEDWLVSPNQELEATFGVDGKVDVTTFLTVAKRLRAKGYRSIAQEDRMTITTPDHVRFSLQGLGTIQEYCKDDVLAGKNFITLIKDRTVPDANVDLVDYDVRVKVRREIGLANDDAKVRDLFANWKQQKKAFRVIRRWTFEGEGLILDLSIVRSTARDTNRSYRWMRLFRDQDVMGSPPEYEIEVELAHVEGDTVDSALKRLVKGVGEILRGIQKHTFLMRKSVRDKVLRGYKDLAGTDRFRGVAPVTMEMPNFLKDRDDSVPNIRNGYNVTDKADGLRVMAFCDTKGELFMIDMTLNVYKTGLTNAACRQSLLDAEWITQTKDGRAVSQLLFFDIYIDVDKKDVTGLPFYSREQAAETRYNNMKRWITTWNEKTVVAAGITAATKLQVILKNFFFAEEGDSAIFMAASQALNIKGIYNTDGLIFTPNARPIPKAAAFLEQFKWKPAHDNTIDFLVKFENYTDSKEERVTVGVKPDTGETLTYKTLRLLVGSSTDAMFENPREAVLEGMKPRPTSRKGAAYRPVPFNPADYADTMASVCYLQMEIDPDTGENYVLTGKSKEPIQDKNIVEMAYDPSQPPGWRWQPLRVRMDKTERMQRGILGRTLNSSQTAESVWNSIHDPITESMIRSGSETMGEAESDALDAEKEASAAARRKYFERTATEADLRVVKGMRDFHNKMIKERVLYGAAFKQKGKTVLDLAVGKGADLQRWRRGGVSFVLGCDNAGDNITNAENGAYRRYLETVSKAPPGSVPPMIFAIADSSKRLIDGTAGETEQEKDILRSVMGRMKPSGPVPPFVEREGVAKLKMGADCVSLMFAIHYFFDKKETFDGLLENIADGLKLGGLFIGCCFDGEKVFDLLRTVKTGGRRTGMYKEKLLWSIAKQYDAEAIPEGDAAFGMGIDVEFISIGTSHREYLVPFGLLQAKMADIGCELLDEKECAELGLKTSTALFGGSHDKDRYKMNEAVQQFSYLNRWFIFKRKTEKVAASKEAAPVPVAVAGPNVKKSKIRIVSALRPSSNAAAPAAAAASAAPGTAAAPDTAAAAAPGTAATAAETPISASLAGPRVAPVAEQAPAAGPLRTLAVASEAGPKAAELFAANEVYQFYSRAALQDKLKIGDKGAGRWLAPNAPFPLKDTDGGSETTYPSLDHYIGGMMYKLATTIPATGVSLFSRDGSIHQQYVGQRLTETDGGTKPLPEDRDYALLEDESKDVKAAMRAATVKKYKGVFDEAKWATVKDQVLRDGLTQRWETDARLRRIVEAVRNQGKILLFYTPGAATNMGGIRRDDGTIEGDNKVGEILMSLAKFPGKI